MSTETTDRAERTAWRMTIGDLEDYADRPLTDEEVERIAKAIDNSTVGDCIAAAVEQVAPWADEEETP